MICRLTIPVREARPSSAAITVTLPVAVTVASELGDPYADLPVYVFDGETYTGFSGTSDANGQFSFTLPQGDYRFRADYDGVQFWSNNLNHCTVPGCEAATVEIPGGTGSATTTIDYTYDPLYRLTAADYTSGEFFHYAYDAVGNRLTEQTHEESNSYTYDIANRLISVNGAAYIWDDKGNLLDDGASAFSYDHANRLVGVAQGSDSYSFAYNGLGDRLRQTVNGAPTEYTLDINQGLTQVLADGFITYLYGASRIGEEQSSVWQYYHGDALGSVRQLTDPAGTVTATRSYEPFGSTLASTGSATTNYSFTGEWADGTGMIHLRARYYEPGRGRFTQADVWAGTASVPMTLVDHVYALNNPIMFRDPAGLRPVASSSTGMGISMGKSLTNELGGGQGYSATFTPLAGGLLVEQFLGCELVPFKRILGTHEDWLRREISLYGVKLTTDRVGEEVGNWGIRDLLVARTTVLKIAGSLKQSLDQRIIRLVIKNNPHLGTSSASISGRELFRSFFAGVELKRGPRTMNYLPAKYACGGCYAKAGVWQEGNYVRTGYIAMYAPESWWGYGEQGNSQRAVELMVHEFGHVFDIRRANADRNQLAYAGVRTVEDGGIIDITLERPSVDPVLGGLGIDLRSENSYSEAWADLFASWVMSDFTGTRGAAWREYIEPYMRDVTTSLAVDGLVGSN